MAKIHSQHFPMLGLKNCFVHGGLRIVENKTMLCINGFPALLVSKREAFLED